MRLRLRSKRVLITGASSGVGRAAADAYAREGAHVALLARGEPALERTAEAVGIHGGRVLVLPADVAEREQVDAAFARVRAELGGLDVLVSNAAVVVFGPFKDVEPEDFDRAVAVTFTGAVNCVRAALPLLEESGGIIVATGSIMTKVPLPTFSSYAASKHALRGFLNSLRIELKAQGSAVRVAMVHPGSVNTPLWEHSTSATGLRPRNPPEGYHSETIADALVECTIHPRKEVTIGAEAKLVEASFTHGGPVGDLVFRAVYHWYMSGRRAMPDEGGLWKAVGDGVARGHDLIGRPSLWAPVRLLRWPLRR